jgi:hypothetical protein
VRIFVGIPAYDRKLHVETVRSLLLEQGAALLAGLELDVMFAPGSSLIHHARDEVVNDFLASGADRLIFVDADVAWEPGALIKIALHGKDFVGGAYRHKADDETYPVVWLDNDELWSGEDGLIEVKALPGGFLSLSRNVFERIRENTVRPEYPHGPTTHYPWFHCPFGRGEDFAFCDDWRAAGGQIWLDPDLTLHHCDSGRKYTGNIGNWLKSR